MFIKNREELDVARKNAKTAMENEKFRILICAGTGCLAGGSEKIYNKMCELFEELAISSNKQRCSSFVWRWDCTR